MRISVAVIALAGLTSLPTFLPAQQVDVNAEIEKLLEAVGGREVWSKAQGFSMSEILYSDQYELPVLRHYWVDFSSPRIMESSEGNGLRQTRALNIDQGWTVKNGEHLAWSAEQVGGWNSFWPGIPTRVFHLLASNDPTIRAEWRDGVIDVFLNDRRIVWLATDPQGIPIAYGREDRHTDTHFLGKPLQYGDVTLWSEAIEPGNDWRVVMVDYQLMTKPHTVSFNPPQNN